jgi:hypothetical protein
MIPKLTLGLRLARRFPNNAELLAEIREDKTIRRTIDAYEYLATVAREQRTTTVADLAAAVKLPLAGTAQAANAKLVGTILAALTNYDFEEATPILAVLVLRRAGKRPPPAFFALIDELGLLASYDDEESFVQDEAARVYRALAPA